MRKIHILLNKILAAKGQLSFPLAGAKKKALLQYVLYPKFVGQRYYLNSHINKSFSRMMVESLLQKGYEVDLLDVSNKNFRTKKSYDLFIGHSTYFHLVASQMHSGCKKILLLSGSSPTFGNQAQKIRASNLEKRRNIKLSLFDDNVVPSATKNLELSDSIILIGNSTTLQTWDEKFHQKINLINNYSLLEAKNIDNRKEDFLFFSSVGQVHRGLDILLDVFPNRKEYLYICSAFKKEDDFCSAYKKELFYTSNIYPVGWVSLTGIKFQNLISKCGFGVLPTCSEGQSSSLLNLMSQGVIPIATKNAGIDIDERYGFIIDDTPDRLIEVLEEISSLKKEKVCWMRKNLHEFFSENHTYDKVKTRFLGLIDSLS